MTSYIKLAGALLVLGGTSCLGWLKCYRFKNRIKRLKNFRETFLILAGQIRFAYISIPEAFDNIAMGSSSASIKEFYGYMSKTLKQKDKVDFKEAWTEGIRLYIKGSFLNEEDCRIISKVGEMPLYMDGQMQIAMLTERADELEHIIEQAERDYAGQCKIWKCAGVVSGILIVLVFI